MAQLLGLGEVTITRYETKQIQDEAHNKIMKLIDENALMALDYLEKNKLTIVKIWVKLWLKPTVDVEK